MTKMVGRVQEGPTLVLWQLVGSSPGLCGLQGGQEWGSELRGRRAAGEQPGWLMLGRYCPWAKSGAEGPFVAAWSRENGVLQGGPGSEAGARDSG